jgi:hypothetical protein
MRLAEGWFTWKLRHSLMIMNKNVESGTNVVEHFNAKDTDEILTRCLNDLQFFYLNKWKNEHNEKCKGCETQCRSIR